MLDVLIAYQRHFSPSLSLLKLDNSVVRGWDSTISLAGSKFWNQYIIDLNNPQTGWHHHHVVSYKLKHQYTVGTFDMCGK